ncbi:MAG TPA: transcription termination factor NusA [Candidatus Gastranaerophilales bacterium]|nr:transcription termination factor NusA [Candidatus Gastranaerophilales bacterium]
MIKVGKALIEATEQLEKEKGISKDTIMRSICDAMITAYKKHIKGKQVSNIVAAIDEINGEIGVFRIKEVVEDVQSEHTEILLAEARQIDPESQIGDEIQVEVTPSDFGRIAAQSAKQVITQRIREAERKLILDEFMSRKGTLVTGVVRRVEPRSVVINIGRSDAILPKNYQIPREYYRINDRLRVCVIDVKETSRLPQVIVSQTDPKIVRELFELEVPEIEDGIIEIKSISREAGFRTKIAVASNDPNVDPVGACIGPRGSRIQTIVNELKNEKIDIVRYVENPVEYITNALSPARIVAVNILENTPEHREAMVIVPDDQLSLAIGKEGQNVRLAHRLTGWKIDIKSMSKYEAMEAEYQQYEEQNYQEETEAYSEADEEMPEEETALTEEKEEE